MSSVDNHVRAPAAAGVHAPGAAGVALPHVGLRQTVAARVADIRDRYRADATPWVVGYSGSRDTVAAVHLVCSALAGLAPSERTKPVHIIHTDTRVDNPVVAAWVRHGLDAIAEQARAHHLPITVHQLAHPVEDSFWVTLIGRGYPAPRAGFRWCTDRLKIRPSTGFLEDLVRTHGSALLVQGTRDTGASAPDRDSAGPSLTVPTSSVPGCTTYTPLRAWSDDTVWMMLLQAEQPWGARSHDLLALYAGAAPGGECPLVVDTASPSCGDSRFGCWVCTIVDRDAALGAMIRNDADREWMLPLLDLRDLLDVRDEASFGRDLVSRDFRRGDGSLALRHFPAADTPPEAATPAAVAELHERYQRLGRVHAYDPAQHRISYLAHGAYTQNTRERLLHRLLETQQWVQDNGPAEVRDLQLITVPELDRIRRIWVEEHGEYEDSLPEIYRRATGGDYAGPALEVARPLAPDDLRLLRVAAGYDPEHDDPAAPDVQAARLRYEALRALLGIAHRSGHATDRDLHAVLGSHAFTSEQDALGMALTAAG